MTPLNRRANLALTLVPLLLTASLAGCIGDTDDSENLEGADVEGFRTFLAAVGQGPAQARIDAIELDVNGTDTPVPLTVHQANIDLGSLSAESQAAMVASGDANGTATAATLQLAWLNLGDSNLTDVELTVPTEFPVGTGIDATITLDLDATRESGNATFDSLVVERGDTRLTAVTRSQLDAPDRVDIPELPTPEVVAFTDANTTGPSFLVNEDINFTYQLSGDANASVRNVFWSFGDDATATGEFVQHAYRTPGFYRVTVIVEGEQGQQATANTTLEAFVERDGEGNVLAGTTGETAVDDRDVKEHTVEIPGNFTSLSLRLTQGPSAGFCSENQTIQANETPGAGPVPSQPLPAEINETIPTGGECLPSNVFIELETPDGTVLGRNTTDADTKFINLTGLMPGGEWTLRVKGDQGVAIGYRYNVEAHYLGLCESAGGVAGFSCPGAPGEAGESGGTLPLP